MTRTMLDSLLRLLLIICNLFLNVFKNIKWNYNKLCYKANRKMLIEGEGHTGVSCTILLTFLYVGKYKNVKENFYKSVRKQRMMTQLMIKSFSQLMLHTLLLHKTHLWN